MAKMWDPAKYLKAPKLKFKLPSTLASLEIQRTPDGIRLSCDEELASSLHPDENLKLTVDARYELAAVRTADPTDAEMAGFITELKKRIPKMVVKHLKPVIAELEATCQIYEEATRAKMKEYLREAKRQKDSEGNRWTKDTLAALDADLERQRREAVEDLEAAHRDDLKEAWEAAFAEACDEASKKALAAVAARMKTKKKPIEWKRKLLNAGLLYAVVGIGIAGLVTVATGGVALGAAAIAAAVVTGIYLTAKHYDAWKKLKETAIYLVQQYTDTLGTFQKTLTEADGTITRALELVTELDGHRLGIEKRCTDLDGALEKIRGNIDRVDGKLEGADEKQRRKLQKQRDGLTDELDTTEAKLAQLRRLLDQTPDDFRETLEEVQAIIREQALVEVKKKSGVFDKVQELMKNLFDMTGDALG